MPSTADDWADEFGALRNSGPAAPSACIGIPLVVTSLLAMLWSAPIPASLAATSPVINAATLFVVATFVYYCILSIRLALGGLIFLICAISPGAWLDHAGLSLWPMAPAVFVTAFSWQLVETRRATGRLHALRTLQYVMLGPIWLLRAAYRRAGLGY